MPQSKDSIAVVRPVHAHDTVEHLPRRHRLLHNDAAASCSSCKDFKMVQHTTTSGAWGAQCVRRSPVVRTTVSKRRGAW